MRRKYDIHDLDCAACSVKIEAAIGEFKEIDECILDFINKKLYIDTNKEWESEEALIEFLEKIVHIFESEVTLTLSTEEASETKKPKTNFFKTQYFTLTKLCLSGLLVLLASVIPMPFWCELTMFLTAYVVIGYAVAIKTFKKIRSKNFFDENLLMTIASIGAFVIGSYAEGVMVLILYTLGEIFQSYAVEKSRRNIKEMLSLKVEYATVIRDGEEHSCKPEKLAIGDKIIVKKGERVPVDGIVVAGNGFVDTSMLTGESKPVKITEGSRLLGGSINVGSPIIVRVTTKFENSSVAKIMELVELASARKPKSEKFITKFARIYTPTVMLCSLVVAFVPPIFLGNLIEWVYRALTFLVLSCPCAIVISVPLTFFSGLGVCAKRGLMIKGANVLETLPSVKTIVFDKTGTLTKGTFEVQKVVTAENVKEETFAKFLCYAESTSNHPIAKSVMKLYKSKIFASKINHCEEMDGKGVVAEIEKKNVIVGSEKFLQEKGVELPEVNEYGNVVYMALNGEYAGYVVISDTIKPNVKDALAKLRKLGVNRFVMLTGDKSESATYIAHELGIDEVYADLMPADKLETLADIMNTTNGKVMYVGDGINDAPVLMASHVGVSMGKNGSDVAIEAGDLVVMNDDIISLVNALKVSKNTLNICLQNIIFALTAKVAILVLGILGISSLWLAVFADVGVSFIAILNAMRMLIFTKK